MAKSGLTRKGNSKKLHTKLIKQKKDKKVEAKNSRLVRLKALRALANKQEEEK